MKKPFVLFGLATLCSGCASGGAPPQTTLAPKSSAAKPFVQTVSASVDVRPKPDVTAQKIMAAARAQLGASYSQEYFSLGYPNGDPPKNVGACTDVIVRALRPAGYDLQKLIHLDMKRNFQTYPRKWGLKRTDRNIDHRRVPNQKRYFERFAQRVSIGTTSWKHWRAGDIVQWKLGGDLDHTGIVSDKTDARGRPLVIHNLGGCREEDALMQWKIVAHFRFPPRR